ncbi:MAG TPA: hypothetical protein VE868_03780 [Balneolaceae bacterium]|nr:hypothetical protein [Balneolaceae bacterium]
MEEEEHWNILIKVIIVLFILALVVGLVRSEILLIPIQQHQVKRFARLTSYLSASFTVIYLTIAIAIIFMVNWFFQKICSFELKLATYLEATTIAFAIFIYEEIIKLPLLYFFLYKEANHLTYKDPHSVKSQIRALTYSHITHYLSLAFIFIAIGAFAYSLKEQKVKNRAVISSSVTVLTLLVVFIFVL